MMRDTILKIGNASLFFLLVLLATPLAMAGGAFSTTPNGDPVLWQDGEVFYRMDPGSGSGGDGDGDGDGGGGCSLISKAHATNIKGIDVGQMVRDGFNQWSSQASGLTVTEGALLPEDVNFSNVENYYVGFFPGAGGAQSNVTADPCYNGDQANCLNSVIFDPNGLITDAILGQCARYSVFGFASILPQVANDNQGTIVSKNLKAAQMVVSGACVTPVDVPDPNCQAAGRPSSCPIELDDSGTGLQGVITHEIGHFVGLDHVLVEKANYLECSPANANCSQAKLDTIPTMIGLAVDGVDLNTLTQDDISAIKGFYPGAGNSTCSMTGVVESLYGNKNGRCFEVVARKQGNASYVVATMSGAYVQRNSQGLSCDTTEADGSQNASTYSSCVNSASASSTLKVHSNCALAPDQCGQFEIRGLESGTYDLTIQTFRNPAGGDSIPFILEPCTQVRNENIFTNNTKSAGSVVVTCPAGGSAGTKIID